MWPLAKRSIIGPTDKGKGRTAIKENRRAKEEALNLEKEQIEHGILNSIAVRERWKYLRAVCRRK
jgi:hypothetical protein